MSCNGAAFPSLNLKGFPDFVRGLLVDPRTPAEIRNDLRLRKELLPKAAIEASQTAERMG
jgi:hypothetical protein